MAKACLVEGKIDGIKFKSRESKIMAAQLLFTEKQSNAIMDMRLYKLIGLEIEALIKDNQDTLANIYQYEDILQERQSMAQVIIDELNVIKKQYAKKRKTRIENLSEAVYVEKKPEELDVVFLMDRFGYARTIDPSTYERNKETADTESRFVLTCKNTDRICLFTDSGQLHTIRLSDLPYGKFRDKGIPIDNISKFNTEKESIILCMEQSQLGLHRLLFVSKSGMVKVVDGGEFDVSKRAVAATKLDEGDNLLAVLPITGDKKDILLLSALGLILRFPLTEIPDKKKNALGVRSMRLSDKDKLDQVYLLSGDEEGTFTYREKQQPFKQIKNGKRDQKGKQIKI
jgi:DNA gyrase subunit A